MIKISYNSYHLKLEGAPILHHATSRATFLSIAKFCHFPTTFFPTYPPHSRIIQIVLRILVGHEGGYFFGYS